MGSKWIFAHAHRHTPNVFNFLPAANGGIACVNHMVGLLRAQAKSERNAIIRKYEGMVGDKCDARSHINIGIQCDSGLAVANPGPGHPGPGQPPPP
jgi:hypothetical protein